MCNNVVIDANSIAIFQHQRINHGGGAAVEAMDYILSNGQIIMDAEQIMMQEWIDSGSFSSHGELNLLDYIADLNQNGKILLHKYENMPDVRNKLREMGMRGRDPMYLITAHRTAAYAVVSDDPDFYDPKTKRQSAQAREKAKRDRRGPVATFARRTLGVEVSPIELVPEVVPPCEMR